MSGAVVRRFGIVKHLLNPASGLLTSRHIACGLHWQCASPITRSHCPCQLCRRRCAKIGIASGYGAGYSSYNFHGCVNNVFVSKKKLQGEIMNVSFGVSNKSSVCIVQARNKTRSTQQDSENVSYWFHFWVLSLSLFLVCAKRMVSVGSQGIDSFRIWHCLYTTYFFL